MSQTILIIEDNPQTRSIYRANLQQVGFTVLEAENGVEGIKALKERVPDLILLDLMMPLMDGFKVLQMVKTNPATREVPVLVLSGRGEPAEIEKALKLGAADFMVKIRTNPKILLEKVRTIVAATGPKAIVPHFLLAVKEHVYDAATLAMDFGLPPEFHCPHCGNPLLLELVPDFSHHEPWFSGHFVCALCR